MMIREFMAPVVPKVVDPDCHEEGPRNWEFQYLDLIGDILMNGDDRVDRTGVGTRALFGRTLDIKLKNGFPIPWTKRLALRPVVSELLWFLEGSGDERRLAEILHGTRDAEKKTIWTANAQADYWKPKAKFDGDLGRVYGVQWRDWQTYTKDDLSNEWVPAIAVDQVAELIKKLKTNPTDRRMIISAWNVGEIGQMALPPCHMMAQFFVANNELSCQMYQRSVDSMLGLPFNIASYALLTHMLAQVCGLGVDRLIMNLGDVHIYSNHFIGAMEQLERGYQIPEVEPTPVVLKMDDVKNLEDFTMDSFNFQFYDPLPAIKMDMAV